MDALVCNAFRGGLSCCYVYILFSTTKFLDTPPLSCPRLADKEVQHRLNNRKLVYTYLQKQYIEIPYVCVQVSIEMDDVVTTYYELL